MTLTELITAIEAGPVTREMEDRVCRTVGLNVETTADGSWLALGLDEDGGPWEPAPSPLSNLQDATLADLPGWVRIAMNEFPESASCEMVYPLEILSTGCVIGNADTLPKARVLAGLKAREQEAEDG